MMALLGSRLRPFLSPNATKLKY